MTPDWSATLEAAAAPLIDQWADQYGLDRAICYGLVSQESRFNPAANGDSGIAYGLTQIHYATAQGIGYTGPADGLYDPSTNLQFGLLYLADMLQEFGDMDSALAAYNGGLHGGTITDPDYVNGVLARADYFTQAWSANGDTVAAGLSDAQGGLLAAAVVGGLVLLTVTLAHGSA